MTFASGLDGAVGNHEEAALREHCTGNLCADLQSLAGDWKSMQGADFSGQAMTAAA